MFARRPEREAKRFAETVVAEMTAGNLPRVFSLVGERDGHPADTRQRALAGLIRAAAKVPSARKVLESRSEGDGDIREMFRRHLPPVLDADADWPPAPEGLDLERMLIEAASALVADGKKEVRKLKDEAFAWAAYG